MLKVLVRGLGFQVWVLGRKVETSGSQATIQRIWDCTRFFRVQHVYVLRSNVGSLR